MKLPMVDAHFLEFFSNQLSGRASSQQSFSSDRTNPPKPNLTSYILHGSPQQDRGYAEKLAAALMLGGVVKAAAALYLVFFKAPGGVFVHNHDKLLFYLYYAILLGVVSFGFMEASDGFWVSGEPVGRRAIGMTILWISILPLVFVTGLGGFAFAVPEH